jgi:hemerythrin-like domain-containing protein
MTLWTLLKNDHANITTLGHTVLRATDTGAVRNRERLVSELQAELEAHFEAEEDSLFKALADDHQVRDLVASLKTEHQRIEEELTRLAKVKSKNTVAWTSSFEDFTYLVDSHFHVEEHELFPQAEALLASDEAVKAMRDFIDEKGDEIRERRRNLGIGAKTLWTGAALLAAAWLVLAARRGWYSRPARDLARRSARDSRYCL